MTALEKKEAMIEWIIDTMVSDKQIQEEKLSAFRQWLAEESDLELKAEGMRRAVRKLASRGFSQSDVDKGSEIARERWRKLAENLGMNPELNYYRTIRAKRKAASAKRTLRYRALVRVAAVLLPVALAVGGYFFYDREQGTPTTFVATHTVASEQDDIRHITLPDGTQVTLNRGATFSYNDSREGELSGEAYFKVAKDTENPFVIRSGHLTVTVLGTEFDFRAYPCEDASTLFLYEGKVLLDYSAGSLLLEEAGTEFSLDHTSSDIDINEFDVTEQPEWLADEALYHFHSLGHVFRLIESNYGVKFENMNLIDTTQHLSFRSRKGVSLETLMSVLKEASVDFDYTINESTITLQP